MFEQVDSWNDCEGSVSRRNKTWEAKIPVVCVNKDEPMITEAEQWSFVGRYRKWFYKLNCWQRVWKQLVGESKDYCPRCYRVTRWRWVKGRHRSDDELCSDLQCKQCGLCRDRNKTPLADTRCWYKQRTQNMKCFGEFDKSDLICQGCVSKSSCDLVEFCRRDHG